MLKAGLGWPIWSVVCPGQQAWYNFLSRRLGADICKPTDMHTVRPCCGPLAILKLSLGTAEVLDSFTLGLGPSL